MRSPAKRLTRKGPGLPQDVAADQAGRLPNAETGWLFFRRSHPASTLDYRADIDGLRAVAILLVVVFHFDLLGIGKAGFIGVDVFFVISGFLITSILRQDLVQGTYTFSGFLYRRIRRLYPALLVVFALFLVAGYLLLLPDMYEELGREVLLSQLYAVNFYFWRTVNYFGLQADTVPLLHAWSLAVEEQFYLVYPLVFALFWRRFRTWLFLAICLAVVGSFTLGVLLSETKPWAAFYLLPTRAWELLAGAVLALALSHWRPGPAATTVCGPMGFLLLGLALVMHTPATPFPGSFALLPVLAAVCLILAGSGTGSTATTTALEHPILVWVGRLSYPWYLVHWPVLILLKEHVHEFAWGWRLVGFAVSLALAAAVFHWVETPLRKGRFLNHPRDFLLAVAAASAALLALCSAVIWSNGMPGRFTPEVHSHLTAQKDEAVAFRHCTEMYACTLGDPTAQPTLLIVGDSHANAFAEAFDMWLRANSLSAHFTFSHACMPVAGIGRAQCVEQMDAVGDTLADDPGITHVVLVSIWRQALGDGLLQNGTWVPEPRSLGAFEDALVETVQSLRKHDVTPILIEPFFAAQAHVPQTLAKNAAFGRNWPLGKPLDDHRAEFAALEPAFDTAVAEGALRVSLLPSFCSQGLCRAVRDGRPLFSDNNHLASGASAMLAHALEQSLRDPITQTGPGQQPPNYRADAVPD